MLLPQLLLPKRIHDLVILLLINLHWWTSHSRYYSNFTYQCLHYLPPTFLFSFIFLFSTFSNPPWTPVSCTHCLLRCCYWSPTSRPFLSGKALFFLQDPPKLSSPNECPLQLPSAEKSSSFSEWVQYGDQALLLIHVIQDCHTCLTVYLWEH